MTLVKLAIKNTQSQLQSFFMYLASMAFGVMVYYSFIAISFDTALLEQVKQNNNLSGVLNAAGLMILLFILVFMFTANSFFLKKRKTEIALYNLLGMRKVQIGALFFLENFLLGLVALVVGLLSGIILSKLFSMILLKAMFLSLDNHFVLSLEAIKKTALMFVLMVLLVSLRSGLVVYRYQLAELLVARQTGDFRQKSRLVTTLTGILGVAFLSVGYYQATHLVAFMLYLNERLASDMGFLMAAFLILFFCVIGSYLVFFGFLPVLLAVLQGKKSYYYSGIKLVTVSQLRFHFRKNATTFGTVAVLLGSALTAVGIATDFYTYGMMAVEESSPTDYIVNQGDFQELVRVIEELPDYESTAVVDLPLKLIGGHYQGESFDDTAISYTGAVTLLAVSDYQRLQRINSELPSISLETDKQSVLFDQYFNTYSLAEQTSIKNVYVQEVGQPLDVLSIYSNNIGGGSSSRYQTPVLVVTDAIYQRQQRTIQYTLSFVNVNSGPDNQELTDHISRNFTFKEYYLPTSLIFEGKQVSGTLGPETRLLAREQLGNKLIRGNLSMRYPVIKENRINFGILVYAAVFLGIVFFIATGSMIMLKQLSEAEEERPRYQLLRKLGVSKEVIRRSIYRQNGFFPYTTLFR